MKTAEYTHGTGDPLILWFTDFDRGDEAEELKKELERLAPEASYTLAVFGVEDWNADLSPWQAEVEGQIFIGGGPATLSRLTDEYIPYLQKAYPDCKKMFLAGYSLAGLFALWALYESGLFDGAACCSGSLWFPGWDAYADGRQLREGVGVYLSLGGKEKNSRSPVLAAIEEATKKQAARLKTMGVPSVLEMNPGGHFADPTGRLAKGIAYFLK